MNLSALLACLEDDPGFGQVAEAARAALGSTVEAPGALHPLIVAALVQARSSQAPVVVVTATGREAEDVATALDGLLPDRNIDVFPSWETLPHERLSPSTDTVGRRVVPMEDMVAKVKVAIEARANADTLIVARTDARTALGLDEALRRGEAYARAGADLVFVESPESEEELYKIGKALKGCKLVANVVQSGARTPELPSAQLEEFGFALAIYPSLPHKAAAAALRTTYQHLLKHGTAIGLELPLMSSPEMHQLMGFQDVWDFEARCEHLVD